MKLTWIIFVFLGLQTASAHNLTVSNIKISVTADSAAQAREQALDEAHQLAFQKLAHDYFPEQSIPSPSLEELKDMVSNFSIDREKTTPKSYMAALTFQFDEPSVLHWVQNSQKETPQGDKSPTLNTLKHNPPLKITATYKTYEDWQQLKKSLENYGNIEALTILTLSPQSADIKITYRGSLDQLKQELLKQGILLSLAENGWNISCSEEPLHSDKNIVYTPER